MIQQLVDFFIQQASIDSGHLGWLIFAAIVVAFLAGLFVYLMVDLFLSFIKSIKSPIKIVRPEKIVKVPEYITPPVNKEIDRYLEVLKKILKEFEENNKNDKLLP